MSDRGFHTPTVGYFALVDGVAISEDMAKKALEITAQLRAAEEERQEKQRQEEEEEEEERKNLPAAKHMHVRQYNGGGAYSPYLLLDPAKVRAALAAIDGRRGGSQPYVLTLHANGDVHFDPARPFASTDRPAELHFGGGL